MEESFLKYFPSSVWGYKISSLAADAFSGFLSHLHRKWNVSVWPYSWSGRYRVVHFLVLKIQWVIWEIPECKSLLLCVSACRKAIPVLTRRTPESQEATFGETIKQVGQVAKTEAICLPEKNPEDVKDSSEGLGCALYAFPHQNKSECWAGSYHWIMAVGEELKQVVLLPAAGPDPLVCPTATSTQNVRSVICISSGSPGQAVWPPGHPRGISFIQVLHAILIQKYFQTH